MADKIALGLNLKTFKPFKAMLVDDSRTLRLMLRQILTSEKFEIILEAENGNEAIAKFQITEPKPDIVFVDVEMPEKDGIQTIKELRPKYPNTKFVMVTAKTDAETVKQLLIAKIDGYIVKPFDRAGVIEKLANLLGRKDLIKQP